MNIILSNNELVNIPEGADPDAVRKMHENRLVRQTTPRKSRRTRGGRGSRGTTKLAQTARVLNSWGRATATALDRVNGEGEQETDSWYTINTGTITAKVNRETGEVTYEDN